MPTTSTHSLFPSVLRTVVPLVAGVIITLAAYVGLDLDAGVVLVEVQAGVTGAYYIVFRVSEDLAARIGWPWLRQLAGVALGWARPPEYRRPTALDSELAARYRARDGQP